MQVQEQDEDDDRDEEKEEDEDREGLLEEVPQKTQKAHDTLTYHTPLRSIFAQSCELLTSCSFTLLSCFNNRLCDT